MPRIVCKFATPEGERYLIWSTVVDAPITFGLPLDEFEDYIRETQDQEDARYFRDVLLPRLEHNTTTSQMEPTVEELVTFNRAGIDQTTLTLEQIVDFFCIRCGHGDQPAGPSSTGIRPEENDN